MKHSPLTPLFLLLGALILVGSSCSLSYPTPETTTESNESTVNSEKKDDTSIVAAARLDLSNQGLKKLPASVLERTDLQELDISHNQLTGALPAEIRHLANLKILDMSYNDLTGVPAEVGQLNKLEILDLSYNQLTGLPYEIGNLKNLKQLILTGNNYAAADLAVILQGIPQVTVIK